MTRHCPTCGRVLDETHEHNRHIRFKLPEPVLDIPADERPERTWGNDVLMAVRDLGSFVRILIPVNCSAGYTVTYSAWLSVRADDLKHAWDAWTGDTYTQLKLNGFLANMLPAWEDETYKKPLHEAVLNPEHTLRDRQFR